MPVRDTWNADDEDSQSKALPGSDSPNDSPEIQAPSASSPVKPYTPPAPDTPTTAKPTTPPPAQDTNPTAPPAQTFSQMEAAGQARPPAPESAPVVQSLTGNNGSPITEYAPSGSMGSGAPAPLPAGVSPANAPTITEYAPPAAGSLGSGEAAAPAALPSGFAAAPPGSTITEYAPNLGVPAAPTGTLGSGEPSTPTTPGGSAPAPAAPSPSSADSILPLLTGKANGTDTSPLQDATTKATLDALQNPNPYNADEVQKEFQNLGAGIDADYDTRQRNLSNDFARRGLYGSVGKDFASGRAADTEIGRRTAKEQLGTSLATAQAQSAAGARAQAIAQGQAGTNAQNGSQLNWLQSLMGYGNDAFNHDLQTANFQQNQNESEQDYLLRLLQAGYGV